MKLSTFAKLLALLVLTTSVCCQDDRDHDTRDELDKQVEKTVKNAAKTVCQEFSPEETDQPDPQLTKRGFFKKVWKSVKNAAVLYAVGKIVVGALGKRDQKPWTNLNSTDPERRRPSINRWWKDREEIVRTVRKLQNDGSQTDICEPESQKRIEKLERAIEILGKTMHVLQKLKKCN
ncbi:unnamed protein product [Lymnaea stagnalis]|uniref:Uncharacterized protein n=1 Tax=Lymnaea stagnalis TaxID=6523 RepID=A0AAV2INE9_LYMST